MAIAKLKKIIAQSLQEVSDRYIVEVTRVIDSDNEFASLGFIGQDIVDTGRLRDSLEVDIKVTDSSIEYRYSWVARDPNTGYPYPVSVWRGFFPFGGSTFVPGRHWDTRAIKNLDVVYFFARTLQSKGVVVTQVVSNVDQLP